MEYEVLKRSHLKRNIIIAVLVVSLISSLILNFTQAKYRTTESIPLIQGTINFSPSDLNLMAVYLNKNGDTISSDKVPHVGYTLNTEQSICEVNDVEDETVEIVYENGLLNFNGLGNKGTKCTAYFDLIPDSEKPLINSINTRSDNDTSVTIEVNATDNIGIYYYYYKLDNEEEIRVEENSYTFEGLEKDSVHTITVRVEDAAGNISETKNKEVIVGANAGRYILASANRPTGQTTDWTNNGTGITYYYAGDTNEVNNWVSFAGFYWRIIRINGDGSIRMIYQGTSANETGTGTQIQTSAFNSSYNYNRYVGYMYGSSNSDYNSTHANTNPSTIKRILDTWYNNNIVKNGFKDYVDGNAGFCGDRRVSSGTGGGTRSTDYQPYTRISNSSPSLSCNKNDIYTTDEFELGNGALTYPIGLISADEAMFAGIPNCNSSNSNNYLYTGQHYWTMSPSDYNGRYGASGFFVNSDGCLGAAFYGVTWNDPGVRPVINLKANVTILSGDGSSLNPYKITE